MSMKDARQKSDKTRKRILDAAAKLFCELGYAGTTVREIGKEARIEAGSIYYYFSSKDDIISEILDIAMSELIRNVRHSIDKIPENTDFRELIYILIRSHLHSIIDNRNYTLATRRITGQIPDHIKSRNNILREEYAAIWRDILYEGQKRGVLIKRSNMSLARLYILGALNWAAEWYRPGRQSIDNIARDLATIVMDGLVAERR
jgi:AcrR family transcriptional regulator